MSTSLSHPGRAGERDVAIDCNCGECCAPAADELDGAVQDGGHSSRCKTSRRRRDGGENDLHSHARRSPSSAPWSAPSCHPSSTMISVFNRHHRRCLSLFNHVARHCSARMSRTLSSPVRVGLRTRSTRRVDHDARQQRDQADQRLESNSRSANEAAVRLGKKVAMEKRASALGGSFERTGMPQQTAPKVRAVPVL